MVLAFKAYLRIGDMVPRSRGTIRGCLHMDDVLSSGELITISFRRFKHSARQGPQSLQVRGECIQGTIIHPASFLRDFQLARGNVQASLFAYPDGSPMLRSEFDVSLKRLLGFVAALRGESDVQIRAAGRWTSDSFKKYIRIA